MEGLDFGGIWFHTFDHGDHAIEADLRLTDSALGTVEDDSMKAHCELYQVLVMHLTIDAYPIVDHDDVEEAVCHLVHAHLQNVL